MKNIKLYAAILIGAILVFDSNFSTMVIQGETISDNTVSMNNISTETM